MSDIYQVGTRVSWDWGQGPGRGHITEVHTGKVVREIGGVDVIRNGSEDNPAYVIEDEHGHRVVKLHSELRLEPS